MKNILNNQTRSFWMLRFICSFIFLTYLVFLFRLTKIIKCFLIVNRLRIKNNSAAVSYTV